ncbi:MAG: hypothetical protein EBT03_10510 [Betaproteobacteria bacterium]|nr:hypothetical protein [Betaproteobacteria bacterium]NCA17656.1 hypothetical protein [Betaproteobacteria bacterium]
MNLFMIDNHGITPGLPVTWGDGSPKACVETVRGEFAMVKLENALVDPTGKRYLPGEVYKLPSTSLRAVS